MMYVDQFEEERLSTSILCADERIDIIKDVKIRISVVLCEGH